jgi:hypothetical protein
MGLLLCTNLFLSSVDLGHAGLVLAFAHLREIAFEKEV